MPLVNVYVGLGSNLSHSDLSSKVLLQLAIEKLSAGGDKVIATSSFWLSDAWPAEAEAPGFVNAACQINPRDNDPALLMLRLHEIEAEFGRERDQKNRWSPRPLDLDLLDYNGLISENYSFPTLPHPRIADRDFVLCPLLEIAPYWVHPLTRKSASQLLADNLKIDNTNNCRLLVE